MKTKNELQYFVNARIKKVFKNLAQVSYKNTILKKTNKKTCDARAF